MNQSNNLGLSMFAAFIVWPLSYVVLTLSFPNLPGLAAFGITFATTAVVNALLHRSYHSGFGSANACRPQEDVELHVLEIDNTSDVNLRKALMDSLRRLIQGFGENESLALTRSCLRILARNIEVGNAEEAPDLAAMSVCILQIARRVDYIPKIENLAKSGIWREGDSVLRADVIASLDQLIAARNRLTERETLVRSSTGVGNTLLRPTAPHDESAASEPESEIVRSLQHTDGSPESSSTCDSDANGHTVKHNC
jgi:hypothetical protein